MASELRQLRHGSSIRKLKRLINDAIAIVGEEDAFDETGMAEDSIMLNNYQAEGS